VTCEHSNQGVDLVDGGFDLAIRLGDFTDSSLVAKKLASHDTLYAHHRNILKILLDPTHYLN
jgi:DNA-binding transcriptional LysR family regulator